MVDGNSELVNGGWKVGDRRQVTVYILINVYT